MTTHERPWASEETEQRVLETFPLHLPPAEFAARDGYGWLDFPFADYRFRDETLDAWIQEAGAILRDPPRLRQAQRQYLTPAEQVRALRLMNADDDDEDDEE